VRHQRFHRQLCYVSDESQEEVMLPGTAQPDGQWVLTEPERVCRNLMAVSAQMTRLVSNLVQMKDMEE